MNPQPLIDRCTREQAVRLLRGYRQTFIKRICGLTENTAPHVTKKIDDLIAKLQGDG